LEALVDSHCCSYGVASSFNSFNTSSNSPQGGKWGCNKGDVKGEYPYGGKGEEGMGAYGQETEKGNNL